MPNPEKSSTQLFVETLTKKTKTKSVLGELSSAKLKKLLDNLSAYIDEKEAEEKAQKEAQKNAKSSLKKIIKETGLTNQELIDLLGVEPNTQQKTTEHIEENRAKKTYYFGDNETWDGTGNPPKKLQELLDEGFDLADFERG